MLRWSINLFRVFGIQLAIHASFLLLLGYLAFVGFTEGGLVGLGWNVGFILLFFSCVVLHELGHSLTARRFGVHVSRILLLPIGGMAEFDRIPRRPRHELLITAAGPAVNFAIAALLLPWIWQDYLFADEVATYSRLNLLGQLCGANLLMGTFNLLPVFPMDGGRIFRALLALRWPYLQATYWAVVAGKTLALVFAAVAAFYFQQYLTAGLFLFIFWAADAEYRFTARKEAEMRYRAEVAIRLPPKTQDEPPLPEPPLPEPPMMPHGGGRVG